MAAAFVARKMGLPATIIVPSSSPQLVVQRLQDQGATVKTIGKVTCDIFLCGSDGMSSDLIMSVCMVFSFFQNRNKHESFEFSRIFLASGLG